ncbi:sensor histidine kinase [Cohnella fermenti]|uniref:histidine kinase n=1 Tax=Cohnella fermenti TaxID=2565925 RepID=A0A4V3WEG7_9BACL|nr:sensor histidine kinase [Cohnella fermenti]THF76255.1 sensor histidine kinase [Cohnella fermenti]
MSLPWIQPLSHPRLRNLAVFGLTSAYAALLLLYLFLDRFKGVAAAALLIALFLLRQLALAGDSKPLRLLSLLSPPIETVLLFVLFWQSDTTLENIVFLLFVADLILHYRSRYALPLAYGGYVAYMTHWPAPGEGYVGDAVDLLGYSLLVLGLWGTKLLLNQRDTILRLNEALREESRAKEETAALRERYRIAEEVHDTIGHTLTVAIVALEGAQLLVGSRPDEARGKIATARDQLKAGLHDVRHVVKAMKAERGASPDAGLEATVRRMMAEVARQTGISWRLRMENGLKLLSLQEYVLAGAVKESVTNAIKHGGAKTIEVAVEAAEDTVLLTVKDDGSGADAVEYGFGLASMRDRVQAVGGQLCAAGGLSGGFEVRVRLPRARGEE